MEWIPRQQNLEADAITNEETHQFDANLRVACDLEALEFIVLRQLLDEGVKLFDLVAEEKTLKRTRAAASPMVPEKKRLEERLKATEPW